MLSLISPYIWVALLSIACAIGLISGYMTLRKLSLLGDIMSHAALPGIALTFLCTYTTSAYFLMAGGSISAILSIFIAYVVSQYVTTARDAILALVLSLFFGFGIITMGVIQKKMIPGQSILNNFLFGNIHALSQVDAVWTSVINIFVIISFILFMRIEKAIAFDMTHARMVYSRLFTYDMFLIFMMVLAIVIGLQSVGILLMSALAIAPGACAYMCRVSSYGLFSLISLLVSIFSCMAGLGITLFFPKIPPGPLIILVATGICIFVALCRCVRKA